MNDLIRRDDAIKAVLAKNPHDITFIEGKPYTKGFRDGYMTKENDCLENIANITSVEPNTGKWIFCHPLQSDDPGGYYCSECKTGDMGDFMLRYKYCPWCGVRMDGGLDE